MRRFIPIILPVLLVYFNSSCKSEIITTPTSPNMEDDSTMYRLIDIGSDLMDSSDYYASQKAFDQVAELLDVQSDTLLRIDYLLSVSELNKNQGNYDKCLNNYYDVLKLSRLIGDSIYIGLAYYNIASVNVYMSNISKARDFNLKARQVFQAVGREPRLIDSYIQFSVICRRDNNLPLAKEYLLKSIEYYQRSEDFKNLAISLNNLGNIFFSEKKYPKAIENYSRALVISKRIDDQYGTAVKYGNIGEVYLVQNEHELAKKYIDSSLSLAQDLGAKHTVIYNYERLVDYYSKTNDLAKALLISEHLLAEKIEIQKVESDNNIEAIENSLGMELANVKSEARISLLEKDKLVIKEEKESAEYITLLTIFLAITLIVSAFIYYKKEQAIRRAQIKNEEMKREQVEKELTYKKKELLSFSHSLSERENFLQKLKTAFSKLKTHDIQPAKLIELKELLYNSSYDGELEIFNRIEEVNASFRYNLVSKFPQLSKEDLRLCSLLVLGLSSKEIANILIIEAKSVDMKRYRLKKKLNIDSDLDVVQFLKCV